MDILYSIGEVLFGAAAAKTVNTPLFTTLENGANLAVGIIKWGALLYVLVKIAILGFKITTSAQDSSSALAMIKKEGMALVIGAFVVIGAFLIHSAIGDSLNAIGTKDGTTVSGINQSDDDKVIKWK